MEDGRQQHTLFLRALTSRLAEVRSLASAWGAPSRALPERAYLASLRRLRDECHEWTAADVLRSLLGSEGALLELGDGSGQSVALRRGFPPWGPACPRCPWLRYVCPVLQALLCSCYEDWLEVGLAACSALLAAVAPMLEVAAQCSAEDLRDPEGGAEAEGEAAAEAEEAAEEEALEEQEQEEEALGGGAGAEEGGEASGGRRGARAAAAAAELEQRTLRHLAAHGALEFTRLAGPLVAALTSAAQCPVPATQRTAGAVCVGLRRALHAVAHLRAAQ